MRRRLAAPLLAGLVGACVAPRQTPPAAPEEKRTAPPTTVVPPAEVDWRDVPLTPGTWRYRQEAMGSVARFGLDEAAPVLLVRCSSVTHLVTVIRPAPTGGAMTIRTSSGSRTVFMRISQGSEASAEFPARDAFLDEVAFSRGRFSVAGPGAPTLYLPAWAEPARVIEDCRAP